MSKNNNVTYKAEIWDVMQHMFENFNDHQLHCMIHFDTHIDEVCLKKAVAISADYFPLIRSKFVENSYFSFPYWEDCKYTSEDMVKMVETENTETDIEKLIGISTKKYVGPQLMINILRCKKHDSLCIVMNHMLCDGAAFKQYLYLLSSIYSHLKHNENYKLNKKMGPRSSSQVFKKFSLLDKAKILKTPSKLSKYNNGFVFPLDGDNSNPFIERRKISRDRFVLIKEYAKSKGATVNDALLAAYLSALHKTLKFDHIAVPCAVDLRKYLPNRQSAGLCNLVSNMICDIEFHKEQTYEETLLKVKKSMDSEKDNFTSLKGALMLDMVFDMLPYKKAKQMVSKSYNNPPIAMTNIGIIDKTKLVFDGLNITDTFINGSIKYKPYFQLAVTTFDNEITLGIDFCGTENDRKKIKEFLYILDNELPF